jgi:hypothetical protein
VSSGSVTPYSQGIGRRKAFFVSNTTSPAPGLRVVIRNQTIGGNTAPYADREYDENRLSEKFFVLPGQEHRSKYLAIAKGANRMTYEIKRGAQVVESGEFVLNVEIQDSNISVTKTLPRQVVNIPCPEDKHDKHDKYDKHDPDRHPNPGREADRQSSRLRRHRH